MRIYVTDVVYLNYLLDNIVVSNVNKQHRTKITVQNNNNNKIIMKSFVIYNFSQRL